MKNNAATLCLIILASIVVSVIALLDFSSQTREQLDEWTEIITDEYTAPYLTVEETRELDTKITEQMNEFTKLIVAMIGKLLLALSFIILYFMYSIGNKNKRLTEKSQNLDAVTANIPGGVQCCRNDDFLTITYMSDGFLDLIGYSADDVRVNFDNQYIKMVYPLDRAKVIQGYKNCTDTYELKYRMHKGNGSLMWILDKGQLIKKSNGEFFYHVMVDITDSVRAEEELIRSREELSKINERYLLVLDMSDSIVFEYDMKSGEVVHGGRYERVFGLPAVIPDYVNFAVDSEIIFPEDAERFRRIGERAFIGEDYQEDEMRYKVRDGRYVWFNVSASVIRDENGSPIRMIGKITDITKQKERSQKLITMAQTDSRSGLLAVAAVTDFIDNDISNNRDDIHAMFVFTIENLDKLTSAVGNSIYNSIMVSLSNNLKDMFRSSDVIGQLDKYTFIVFLKNTTDALVMRKATDITENLGDLLLENPADESTKLFSSLAISVYPDNGTDYKELYDSAMSALNVCRQERRGGFMFAGEAEEILEKKNRKASNSVK